MIVGALIDAGVPLAEIRSAIGSLSLDESAVWTERVQRAGVTATKFQVRGEELPEHSHPHVHDHAHDHEHHDRGPEGSAPQTGESATHRTLDEIFSLIDR